MFESGSRPQYRSAVASHVLVDVFCENLTRFWDYYDVSKSSLRRFKTFRYTVPTFLKGLTLSKLHFFMIERLFYASQSF